jgi:hypothetical protein
MDDPIPLTSLVAAVGSVTVSVRVTDIPLIVAEILLPDRIRERKPVVQFL